MIIGADRKFIIDANTGEIRTSSSPLDREERSTYQLTAVATDPGNRQVGVCTNLCPFAFNISSDDPSRLQN